VLTLLALPRYASLLTQQPFSSRRSVAHTIISSVLKNETVVETPEDVDGILELCHVLIKDQTDVGAGGPGERRGPYYLEREEMAEEQGWVARMVHLFRSDTLDVQFEVRKFNPWCMHILMWINDSCCKPRGGTSKLAASECGSRILLLLLPVSSFVDVTRTMACR
jgi:hypothetical protein